MEMSGALAVVDKLIEDSTSVVPKKKKEKQTAAPTRRSERLNPQSPPSMILRVVYNIDEESLQDSDSIAIGVSGFIEASREYDRHDLLSEDDKSEIESRLTEGFVIDAYFDLLKERIQDNPEVHLACLFGKHFAQAIKTTKTTKRVHLRLSGERIPRHVRSGHINPALQLARRLTTSYAAHVTYVTTTTAHQLGIPSALF
ncbi:hypothetical protein QJS10_CPA01g01853 [Acorus calamus]|uniref:Uncharacterized protein n=1 Tax=Acorus calamus TaxID=4465 RepID=A0AAV9FJY8_ACOCL|nr:hypothetical protein QJS10_CPA01g01853 [Acorus calamus]